MKKLTLCLIYLLTSFSSALVAQDIIGFWKSYDEKTGKPQIIVAVYEHQQKYFGRVIASFDKNGVMGDTIYAPTSRTDRLVGDPFYVGLDIIWNLQKRGSKYSGGEILDPKRGKVYNVEMWTKNENLIVRGKLLFFGKNLTWYPAVETDFPEGFVKPDLTKLVPSIPQIK
jgi:uncharacterized protein (DUF2147 family)